MFTWYGILIIPLITGIVEVLKRAGLPPKYAGLASLILGLGLSIAYGQMEAHWALIQSILVGLALGLAASGLYSQVRALRCRRLIFY